MSTLAPGGTRPAVDVADLLGAGECSPQCLLALEPGGACVCRCGGEFHGALITAEVRPVAEPQPRMRGVRRCRPAVWDDGEADDGWPGDAWWRPEWRRLCGGQGDAWASEVLDMVCPVVCEHTAACCCDSGAGGVPQEPGFPPTAWAQPEADGSWSVHAACHDPWPHFTPDAAAAQAGLLGALAAAGRCRRVHPGRSAGVHGIGRRIEAQIIGNALITVGYGYGIAPATIEAIRAIGALPRSRPDAGSEVMSP